MASIVTGSGSKPLFEVCIVFSLTSIITCHSLLQKRLHVLLNEQVVIEMNKKLNDLQEKFAASALILLSKIEADAAEAEDAVEIANRYLA